MASVSHAAALVVAVGAILSPVAAEAVVSSIQPGAVVIYPYVVVDDGLDTIIEVANTDAEAVAVRCFYDDETPICRAGGDGTGECVRHLNAPEGCLQTCGLTPRLHEFFLRLTPGQPLHWAVSRGRNEFPLPDPAMVPPDQGNSGSFVPPLPDTFRGALRCVAVHDDGSPRPANGLIGTATVRHASGVTPEARYNAATIRAQSDGDGDSMLTLGGPDPEYQACPQELVVTAFADGATVTAGEFEADVLTSIALVPCVQQTGERTVLQFLVYNEYSQRFSTSSVFRGQFVSQLAAIDTRLADPTRSIFGAPVLGTMTSQVQVRAVGDDGSTGVVGIALENRSSEGTHSTGTTNLRTAALQLDRELLSMDLPPCTGDCDSDGSVTVDEITTGVVIALGEQEIRVCRPFDVDHDQGVTVDEVIAGTDRALDGCVFVHEPVPTRVPPTPAEPAPTPSPTGPEVVTLAVTQYDGTILEPDEVDDEGRPVFVRASGQGFLIVAEARSGANGRPGGNVVYDQSGALPDFQMIVSRPLGDGSEAICDTGGVPATESLQIDDSEAVRDAVNDLGCRIMASPSINVLCTRDPVSLAERKINDHAQRQYCLPIAKGWRFPAGDTIVAARLRDNGGTNGPLAEMVVRVAE